MFVLNYSAIVWTESKKKCTQLRCFQHKLRRLWNLQSFITILSKRTCLSQCFRLFSLLVEYKLIGYRADQSACLFVSGDCLYNNSQSQSALAGIQGVSHDVVKLTEPVFVFVDTVQRFPSFAISKRISR